jgi:hypothetical protein
VSTPILGPPSCASIGNSRVNPSDHEDGH